ncbi:MAG: SDR family oxidoreductase [Rhizonema sp. PD38]|nr:SDR family oxidoreductase [Rhizonema sp. PD38]
MSDHWQRQTFSRIQQTSQSILKGLSRRKMLLGGIGLAGVTVAMGSERIQANTVASQPSAANPQGKFAGKVVLITGATSGIGEGTAYAFARLGARVFFCGRRENLGQQVAARIKEFGGEATYMRADVRREEEVKAFVDRCVSQYGRIDIAFNNAGIATSKNATVVDQPLADWQDILTTNATGVFLSMKYELPYLLRNQPQGTYGTKGVIINTASVSGHVGFANISPYSASKHAIVGVTQCAALEFGPKGIRINSISPGGVDTPMRRRAYLAQGFSPDQPLPTVPNLPRRVNTVEEMANAVMFIASEEASSIFGTDIDVTGGMLTGAYFTQAKS